jgi:hypothetical protein
MAQTSTNPADPEVRYIFEKSLWHRLLRDRDTSAFMHYLMPRKNPLREITANQLAEQIGCRKKWRHFFGGKILTKNLQAPLRSAVSAQCRGNSS